MDTIVQGVTMRVNIKKAGFTAKERKKTDH